MIPVGRNHIAVSLKNPSHVLAITNVMTASIGPQEYFLSARDGAFVIFHIIIVVLTEEIRLQ